MADPTDRQASDPVEGETVPTLNAHEAESFKRESIPKIKDYVNRLYGDYRRDPMRILGTLASVAGRPINVRQDYNAKIPYAEPSGGAIDLHVLHKVPNDVVAKYKAFIEAEFKPELVRLAKELDRAVQEDLREEARKGVEKLNEARQKITGAEFDPIDPRLLALVEEPEGVHTVTADSSHRVHALLRDLFSQ